MPHYTDGTEAKVGDIVKGTTYNRKGRAIVGELLSVTPNAESCNCTVAFVETVPLPAKIDDRMTYDVLQKLGAYPKTTHLHGGGYVAIVGDIDYGETRAFDLVHRPEAE